MKKKTAYKIYMTDDECHAIDAMQEVAKYTSRSAFIVDAALLGTPVHLTAIAEQIGRLGLLCNDLMAEDESGNGNRKLQGINAQKALSKILKTCDAVTFELRRH